MRKIVITSGKGGVGKTTVVASLGRALCDLGQNVVLVDADVGLNNLDVSLSLENKVVYDIIDVISGRCRVSQALIEDTESGLYILPSAQENPLVTAQTFRNVIDSLVGFDYVLIDCPAGIENGFHRAVSSATEAIVVTTPSISSLRDADKVISLLSGYQITDVSVIVNRIRGDMIARGEMMTPQDITRLLRSEPLGIVPEDELITLYSQVGKVPEYALSDKAFKMIAENLHYGTGKIYEYSKGGFFSRFKRRARI